MTEVRISINATCHDGVSFEVWMETADKILEALIGVTSADLEDWTWRDAYDCGDEAISAVREFLQDVDIFS